MRVTSLCLALLALLLASATLALGKQDPELKQCKHQCRAQQQFGREKRELCVQRCEEYYREEHGENSDEEDQVVSWNRQSPIERLRECSRRCQKQFQPGQQQTEQCQQRCQKEYEKEREQYEGGRGGRRDDDDEPDARHCREQCRRHAEPGGFSEECIHRCQKQGGRGRGDVGIDIDNPTDPQREFQQCRETCYPQAGHGGSIQECEQRCEEKRRERERHGGGRRGSLQDNEETYGEREEENPYVFEDRHFRTGMQTQHGRVRILQKFTDRSKLLKGIENYRISFLEMEPQTFIVPNHWDAEAVFFVVNGRGTVSMVRQNRRESFNIREGDIVRIKAGTTTYLVNRDNNQRLVLAKLLQPVSTPGQFEAFFGAGGENPESFFRAFSDEILEAAFNVRRDRLQRLFGQQKQGVIIKASQEQVRAMSHHEEGGIWPFGGESKGSINLYEQRPTQQNQYGQLFEVDSSHYRELRDLDVTVSLANITQGAMTGPFYNSKATKIAIVVEGEGYFEMACPHVSQSRMQRRPSVTAEEQGHPSYRRISSRLKRGTVVVVPAGHPFVAVASKNQNLQLVCFEVNSNNNERFALAGKRNVLNQIERQAKELAFGIPAREVEEIFRSQEEELFFRGPRQQQQGRADE